MAQWQKHNAFIFSRADICIVQPKSSCLKINNVLAFCKHQQLSLLTYKIIIVIKYRVYIVNIADYQVAYFYQFLCCSKNITKKCRYFLYVNGALFRNQQIVCVFSRRNIILAPFKKLKVINCRTVTETYQDFHLYESFNIFEDKLKADTKPTLSLYE